MLLGALLRSAQVEAFNASAVMHDAIFINGHRNLWAAYHTTNSILDCLQHLNANAEKYLHHSVVAAMWTEFTGGIHANFEACVALQHKCLHCPDHLASCADNLYAHLQQHILHGEIGRHYAHTG